MKNSRDNQSRFMLRSEFLKCLVAVYGDASTDYLLALRDGLSVLINKRINPATTKPLADY